MGPGLQAVLPPEATRTQRHGDLVPSSTMAPVGHMGSASWRGGEWGQQGWRAGRSLGRGPPQGERGRWGQEGLRMDLNQS